MPKYLVLLAIAASLAMPAARAQSKSAPECRGLLVERSRVEICLARGAAFQHDTYTLRVDGALIFALTDDYAEQVELTHTVPEGLTIEYPLSKQGEKIVKIVGGCLPEIKDGAEVARVCNFRWGKYPVVRDQRFEFQ